MGQLQCQVRPIALPSGIVAEPAVHEVGPNGLECHARRSVNVSAELGTHVKPCGMKIGDCAYHGGVEASNISGPGWNECLPKAHGVLLPEHPADRVCGDPRDVVVGH